MLRAMARSIIRAVDHWCFPPHCLVSGTPLHGPTLLPGIDDVAWLDLPSAPDSDALIAHLARRFGPDELLISSAHALIAIDDQGAGLHMLHAIKYGGRRALARAAGRVLGEVLAERGMECDVLVPVPIHRARLRERGYNQAALIAEGMSFALQRPTMQALERRRYTGTQTSLGAMDRLRNLRDAIGLRVDANLRGSRVLLVDDVLTTGATLQACALPLIEGGARRVDVATLAATI